jgi:hypothetical protein
MDQDPFTDAGAAHDPFDRRIHPRQQVR